ncbi:thioredoxin fold domain-containing protein [Castellaniella sp.]|uniref:thioredoxin fold domain-containing protein n=1 Tax=Castellaniella sp. TaxID=1955812 RepID=UPI002AFF4ADC|nr:thioredoxin fold domain-containing protein [Castellaniella sp.]
MKFQIYLAALILGAGLSGVASAAPADADTPDAVVIGTSGTANAPDAKVLSTAATPEQIQTISQAFGQRFPGIQVDAVRLTPMPGIFEIQVGLDLVYADDQVNYVLQGSLIDAKARRDLTAERLELLQQVAFDSLPLERAIRQVKGTGARQIAVFEDPNCGYCKQLHQTLESIDDVTVYTFLYPILSPDSNTKSRDIWCASDPAATWKSWMVRGEVPATADCSTPIDENLALGRQLNVRGTPAIFFADGSRVNGALPLDALKQKLDAQGAG